MSNILLKFRYKKTGNIVINGLWLDNPIFSMVLGICSSLAITNRVENAIAMGLGVTFVTTASSLVISSIRGFIPSRVRMITYMVLISTFVISVDIFFKTFLPPISVALGPYVGLIITNCIVMGRAEAFAIKNPVGHSVLDGIFCGLGYTSTLIILSSFREVLAFGTLLGFKVMPGAWVNWVVMSMAPGGFFMLAVYIWVMRTLSRKEEEGCC